MNDLPLVLSVTTLGRIEPLRTLLRSLEGQLLARDRIVIVAQDRVEEVRTLAADFQASLGDRLRVGTSARGASVGRNTGVTIGAGDLDDALLMFPNDTTWFPEGALDAIRAGIRDAPAGAVTVMTSSGPRFVLPAGGTPLDAHTVWQVIEMGLVIRLGLFRRAGGFDEAIGTGAASPWQAGEVTDLLLRSLATEPDLSRRFRWLSAQVGGVQEGSGLTAQDRAWKLRAYGRGIGHVYRTHRYSWARRWAFVVAGLLVGVRRPAEYRLRDGVPAFAGRWEGVTGRVAKQTDVKAVTR